MDIELLELTIESVGLEINTNQKFASRSKVGKIALRELVLNVSELIYNKLIQNKDIYSFEEEILQYLSLHESNVA